MGIGEIKSLYRKQKQYKDDNDKKVATSWDESMFYSKDVLSTQGYISMIDKGLNDIKGNISSIRNKINTKIESSFYNTDSDLKTVNSKIPTSITTNLSKEIKDASKKAHDKYMNQYKNNLEEINSLLENVLASIQQHDNNTSRIDSLRREISFTNKNGEEQIKLNSLYSEIGLLERRNEQIITKCSSLLNQIENLNNKNVTELLSKGLAKA